MAVGPPGHREQPARPSRIPGPDRLRRRGKCLTNRSFARASRATKPAPRRPIRGSGAGRRRVGTRRARIRPHNGGKKPLIEVKSSLG